MWAGLGWLGCGVRRIGHPSMYACQLMVPCVDSALKSMKSSPRLGAVRGQGSGLRACGRRVQRGTACTRRWAARAGRGVRGSGRRVSAVWHARTHFFAAQSLRAPSWRTPLVHFDPLEPHPKTRHDTEKASHRRFPSPSDGAA